MQRRWKLFLAFSLVVGSVLRLLWPEDMEYKEDEEYMFLRLMNVGVTEPLPWLGIPSGVYIKNPGMSVWIFLVLGKLFRATDPMALAQAVQILNIMAIGLILFFALKWVTPLEQKIWFWAMALVSVNPFAVMYHRKIWAQSVLPFFSMLFLMAWWKRDKRLGAFFWGLLGACLGQIHMSGFFFSAGFVLWAFFFDQKKTNPTRTQWKSWLLGSLLGSLTLIPWLIHFFTEKTGHPLVFGWNEAIQLKFWIFWVTDTLGLHLGNALGVHNGNGIWEQLSDFIRYPLMNGHPTFMVGVAHVLLALLGFTAILRSIQSRSHLKIPWTLVTMSKSFKNFLTGGNSETAFTQNAALFGFGALLTLTTVLIHRFYLTVTFPLEFVWLSKTALTDKKYGHYLLGAIFTLELFVSINFLTYIHTNQGAPRGDYGTAYHAQER